MKVDQKSTSVQYGSSSDIITCPIIVFYIYNADKEIDAYYYEDEQKKFIKYNEPPVVVPFEQVLYPSPI